MSVYVIFDEPLIVTCDRCGGGRGDFVNPCDRCGATGGVPPDAVNDRGACLAHNLAIGAALCRAFELGDNPQPVGPGRRGALPSGGSWWIPDALWHPGCGVEAP